MNRQKIKEKLPKNVLVFYRFCRRMLKGEFCSHPEGKLMVEEKIAKFVDENKPNVYLSRCICRCGKRVLKKIPYARQRTAAGNISFGGVPKWGK